MALKKLLSIIAAIIFLAGLYLIFTNPALLVLALLGIIGLVLAGIYRAFNNQNMPLSKPVPDDDDSLEDDIRHHDYGYPGFYHDDDEDR